MATDRKQGMMIENFEKPNRLLKAAQRLIQTINHKNGGNADEQDVQRELGRFYQIYLEEVCGDK